jgi:hypothetical protein
MQSRETCLLSHSPTTHRCRSHNVVGFIDPGFSVMRHDLTYNQYSQRLFVKRTTLPHTLSRCVSGIDWYFWFRG